MRSRDEFRRVTFHRDSRGVPGLGHIHSDERPEFAVDVAANGLVVIYRSCPGSWLLARLQELRKFLKTEFGRQWACGLWRAPEDTDEALSCSVDGLYVIETGNTQQITDFVSKLNGVSMI